MKKYFVIGIFLLGVVTLHADSSWLLKLERKTYSTQTFKDDFTTFASLNYPKENVNKLLKDRKLLAKYFYQNYLVKTVLTKYANEVFLKANPNLKKAFSRILYLSAVSTFVQHYHISRYIKDPTDAILKKMHQTMKAKGYIKPQFKNAPFSKMKASIKKIYYQQQQQFLLMTFVNKVQQENRIIYNDDLEQDLIKKYAENKYSASQMQSMGNKLWLVKFNNDILSMRQIEDDLISFLTVNGSKNQLKKFHANDKYKKRMRKVFLSRFNNIYFLYFFAKRNGYLTKPKFKRFIDFLYGSNLIQSFVAIKFKPRAKQPTDAEMKVVYNKFRASQFKNVKFKDAKELIKNRLMFQQLQRYQMSLYERLKGRYKFKVNVSALKNM